MAATNNGLERGNRTIKDLQEHKRLPLGDYMIQLLRVLRHRLSLKENLTKVTPISEEDWRVVQVSPLSPRRRLNPKKQAFNEA